MMSGLEDNEQKQDERKLHEWSAFYDDERRLYFYNNTTGESSWDAPEQFNPPPDSHDTPDESTAKEAEAEILTKPDYQDDQLMSVEQNASSYADLASPWVAYEAEDGREYYFNPETQETTWERPTTAQEAVAPPSPLKPLSPAPSEEIALTSEGHDVEATEEHIKTSSEDPDHAHNDSLHNVENSKAALEKADAIMEPGVMNDVTEVVTSENGNPQNAIQALSESYYGQTAVCGLLGRWLADLKSQSSSSDPSEQKHLFMEFSDDIRETAQGVVNQISKERFTKAGGDSILILDRSEAAFLEEMMDSNRWRKLLIDLSASNKDSALLMYCLQAISKRGHHREIARRINQSDHFAVFNAMLSSELAVLGKIAVSACRGTEASIGVDELVGDLRRTCTSTAYTYIYAIEVLRHLVLLTKDWSHGGHKPVNSQFLRAVRKWERLNEDLQTAMVDPSSSAGSTPLFRKRRLDVAVTISELHQRQRRRLRPSDDDGYDQTSSSNDDRNSSVESAVLSFLRRYSLGTKVEDPMLDAMLPGALAGDTSNLVGNLLIKRPLTIKALLGYLFRPGNQRVHSIVTKNKCARLIALAVSAAEQEARLERKESVPRTHGDDEVRLPRMLVEGSRLCETLENMVSFIATSATDTPSSVLTPGEQLSSLAHNCAPVAQGVGMWARDVINAGDFVISASYPTLSPSILSLVRILYMEHPFIRDDALEVAFGFLKHSNSEISYQKMNEIKEQSVRLLLLLVARGEAPAVLSRINAMVKQPGNSMFDPSLIRYFVAGLLQVVRTPLSVPFIRLLGSLLKSPSCIEAIKASYFGAEDKKRLELTLQYLKKRQDSTTDTPLTSNDVGIIRSVLVAYEE